MKTTIRQIAKHNADQNQYFFSKNTLKVFEERLSDWSVLEETCSGCLLYNKKRKKLAQYDKKTGLVSMIRE